MRMIALEDRLATMPGEHVNHPYKAMLHNYNCCLGERRTPVSGGNGLDACRDKLEVLKAAVQHAVLTVQQVQYDLRDILRTFHRQSVPEEVLLELQ